MNHDTKAQRLPILIGAIVGICLTPSALGQFSIDWSAISCGSGVASGGDWTASSTLGRSESAGMSGGFFSMAGGVIVNAVPAPPPCPGDLTGDRSVNTTDLTIFLGAFGSLVPPANPAADFDANGVVNTVDLVFMIGQFGNSCP